MAELQSESSKLLSDMVVVLGGVNWYQLGIHLYVPLAKLNAIKKEHDTTQMQLIAVLSYHQDNGEMSWEKIIEALEKIGCHAKLIISIQSKYITPGQQASATSAVSNTQLKTDDMHVDEVATSAGTDNEGTLNGATDQMSNELDGSKQVKIGNEMYSLDVVPAAESKVVAEEKKNLLLGVMDLKTLVDDLEHAGAFIRFGYHGVMAAGPRYTELQIEIRQRGIDITKLCNESALTVSRFQMTSATVLSNLQAAFGYLLLNKAKLAIDILLSISELAGQMEEAALELHSKFDKEEKEVANTYEKTQRVRARAEIRMEEKGKEQEQLQIQLQHEQQVLEDAKRLEREAEADRRQIEAKEDEAISEIRHIGVFKSLVNGILRHEVFDEGLRKVDRLKKKRIWASEIETKRRKQRYEAMERRTAYTIMIQNCKSEQEMAKGAEEALQKTACELHELSIVMIRAAFFWKQIHNYCKSIIEQRVKSTVQRVASTMEEEDRTKIWTSHTFKEEAIRFYAGWVALNTVCTEYTQHIKKTQQQLHKYIKETPTHEEARRNIHKLAETFRADLSEEMEALEQDS